ncbi:cysteine--tRNA ligase [Halalkalicoccus jeotgali]|uniref:Cysteine--tRNA ligase n=1 Tax=Halalkalicoccus jeotgali (strain DSM 18796 / CECT 7217 / JCM 14584 / KCTC 4019 / B3) TaxID=795797 RepID=D8J2W9_HALJB|nr:cysteine--tRNA ligase [Halalkalicoccus jeotgali]ADJ15076.1 cysteinyl-tRNA synthetase [Halalkalicoccus jeotgali B3]ELY34905.1 cysteinyl-tRNA synthetase [Halalkalicoccus jeotgali B3]
MLSVTNTLSDEREEFRPTGDEVLVYVCGLTVSDDAHLGHARVWVHADVMCRWLSHEGHAVRHVENFTDVNEKIAARIDEGDLGGSELGVARRFIEGTLEDMRGLNLQRATVYPRVSEHVPEILALIERLLESGHAYESDGSVYFDVTTFEEYGKLSNQRVTDLEAQGDPTERSEKRNPADFALWKAGGVSESAIRDHEKVDHAHPPDGETWDSPWGEGRPGWHIECSAMAMTHLDETIDIHVGGHDLVFPHHENEIAQSEAATGKPFANYWLHTGLLETDGEKMSSSLGNFFTVSAALDEFGPDVLRSFYLATEYGSNQTFSEDAMAEAKERYERLERAYERAIEAADGPDARTKIEDHELRAAIEEARGEFVRAMNDDFGVREAMSALLELAGALNRHLDAREEYDYRALRRAIETIEGFGGEIFGFSFGSGAGDGVDLAGDLVELVLEVREAEREAGNYERADALREDLEALGVTVEDEAEGEGTTYRLSDRS